MKSYKEMFPIFKNYPDLVYLDSAATCQRPEDLMQALSDYYLHYNSNIGRGAYELADLGAKKYHESKKTIASFFDTNILNIAMTYGATDSLNQAAFVVEQELIKLPDDKKKGYIIISCAEHHANILPWLRLAHNHELKIHMSSVEEMINPELIEQSIQDKAIAYICSHVSNVTGEVLPIEKWIHEAEKNSAFSVIDGSQAVASFRISLDKLNCDFYAFSAHKMYGPMGVGVLYMSRKILKSHSEPLRLGGGIVDDVIVNQEKSSLLGYSIIDNIEKYEAGTPNAANVYAFAKTIEWMLNNQWYNCIMFMSVLGKYLHQQLVDNDFKVLEFSPELPKTHISSFITPSVHSHDVGTFLSKQHIAVRSGKHCAYPLYSILDINSSTRASIGLYNTHQDIDKLIINLKLAQKFFNKDYV